MHDVKEWAEVHRLFHRERWSKTVIAEKLHMSRNTVDRLLSLEKPPHYEREKRGSALDAFSDDLVAMLAENPAAPATVILERLRPLGYSGGITVLKERLATMRPLLKAAKSYQRTSYLPGEIGQTRLVAHGRADSRRQGGDEGGLRPRHLAPALRRARRGVHLRPHDGGLRGRLPRLPRAPRRGAGEDGHGQRVRDGEAAKRRPRRASPTRWPPSSATCCSARWCSGRAFPRARARTSGRSAISRPRSSR